MSLNCEDLRNLVFSWNRRAEEEKKTHYLFTIPKIPKTEEEIQAFRNSSNVKISESGVYYKETDDYIEYENGNKLYF